MMTSPATQHKASAIKRTHGHGGALASCQKSQSPYVNNPLLLPKGIIETLMCIEETDLVRSTKGLQLLRVGGQICVVHSLPCVNVVVCHKDMNNVSQIRQHVNTYRSKHTEHKHVLLQTHRAQTRTAPNTQSTNMLMIKETNRAIAEGRQEEAELTECTEKKKSIYLTQ